MIAPKTNPVIPTSLFWPGLSFPAYSRLCSRCLKIDCGPFVFARCEHQVGAHIWTGLRLRAEQDADLVADLGDDTQGGDSLLRAEAIDRTGHRERGAHLIVAIVDRHGDLEGVDQHILIT